MKKISWSCIGVGLMSIGISIFGLVLPPEKCFNVPFQLLMFSLSYGTSVTPESKLNVLIETLNSPFFVYIFSIILFLSGIGTILIKRWGKSLAYIYSISLIFLSVIGTSVILIEYIGYIQRLKRYDNIYYRSFWSGPLVYIVFLFAALSYPAIQLIFFSRPKIKEKFSRKRLLLQ